MKLLFIIEHIKGGGAERVICELSKKLEETNDVTLVVFENRESNYEHCSNYINLNLPGSTSIYKKIPTLIKRIYTIRKLKKQERFDRSISFINTANIVNVLSGGNGNITSIRTVLSAVTSSKISKLFYKFILNKSNKIVALSDYVKTDLQKEFGISEKKIITIYNPCNCDFYKKYRIQNENYNSKIFTFVTAGRCIQAKGQWHLIKAFALLVKDGFKVKLEVLGEGPLFEDLVKLASQLGVFENISFRGFVDNPAVVYSQSNVFVLSSLWEGFGNALVEAMACGLPVICTNCEGGPSEIVGKALSNSGVEHEYGLLAPRFKSNDINLDYKTIEQEDIILYTCMKMFIGDFDFWKSYSQKAIQRSKDFDINNISRIWESNI